MKKALTYTAMVVAIFTFAVMGCTPPGSSSAPEFAGTWQATFLGVTETWVLSSGSASVTDSGGGLDGTANWSITTYDTVTKHIQLSLSSATGVWALLYSKGAPLYMTYSVVGSTLTMSYSASSYPSSGTQPYLKQ